ncbi:hypothetical protein D3C75_603760 [compost metagenome]
MLLRKPVKSGRVCLQQGSHLIDERSGTACTGGVHPLLNAAVQINDLGILSAKLNCCIALRNQLTDRFGAGNNLLNKGDSAKL